MKNQTESSMTACGTDKIPTPKVSTSKFPPLNQWDVRARAVGDGMVSLSLPAGGYDKLLPACSRLSPLTRAGLCMIASLLWSSRKTLKGGYVVMRLVKAAARRFVDRVDGCANPASFVANAWGCVSATRGCNINGKVANTWFLPEWCDGASENVTVRLTPHQLLRWNRRGDILRRCLDDANPHAALVRKTLMLTTPGPAFDKTALTLTEAGERQAARNYRKKPHRINLTRDGDVQSNVSRLPDVMREALQIDGYPVAEFDVKSAHAVLLGMFYKGETGEAWIEEKDRFADEAQRGFPSIYGEEKIWKVNFLSALNQRTCVARHASEGYRTFERQFPLLAAKVARLKRAGKNAVGRRLRCALAKILERLLIENHADGISTIPVVDSAVVAMPDDAFARHQAEFRTAWRLAVPMGELAGVTPTIVGSNGDIYRFHL